MADPTASLAGLGARCKSIRLDASADKPAMKCLVEGAREADLEAGGAAPHREAPLIGHFSYFKPKPASMCIQLSGRGRRSAKEHECVNAAGAWGEMALAGAASICEGEAGGGVDEAARQLHAARACMGGVMEALRQRMGCMHSVVEHGAAEARLVASAAEEMAAPTSSVAMHGLKVALPGKKAAEVMRLLSKRQAERALRAAEKAAGPAAPVEEQLKAASAEGAAIAGPHWLRAAEKAGAWSTELDAGGLVVSSSRLGAWGPPRAPLRPGQGQMLGEAPQAEEGIAAGGGLERRMQRQVVEKAAKEEAQRLVRGEGGLVSSAFAAWQGDKEEKKARLAISLSQMSAHWEKGSVKVEPLEGLAQGLKKGGRLIALDAKPGTHNFRLRAKMRRWLAFRCSGECCRCIAPPLGWGRGVWRLCRLMRPPLQKMRGLGHSALGWVDDFVIKPRALAAGGSAAAEGARGASGEAERLLGAAGAGKRQAKGLMGEGAARVDHLGVIIDAERATCSLPERKAAKMRRVPAALLKEAGRGRRCAGPPRPGSRPPAGSQPRLLLHALSRDSTLAACNAISVELAVEREKAKPA